MPFTAEEMHARVLYRDPDLLILDKPFNLPVHYGTKSHDHLELYLPFLQEEMEEPPRLAHRLDKDTTGCLLLGRHKRAAARIAKLFTFGYIAKTYWAVTIGAPEEKEGRIDLALTKQRVPGASRMFVSPKGKEAVTDYRVLAEADGFAWVELYPRTGRMHQLRAHLAAVGHPILGDPMYGDHPLPPAAMHLHARAVTVPWGPRTEPPLSVTAPLPAHMRATLERHGFPLPE
ncbi:MAG TPA: RNA pseudouridine synthase [Azospirillaceae bacterium]|nr:RNA pseudouridine synthase [Azospirillaceae bacterium]